MVYNAEGKEEKAGGKIPVEERTAFRTYSDKHGRTNVSVLVANHPVISRFHEEIFPPHNGFVTANHDVVYYVDSVPVLERKCQIMLRPDASEATVRVWEHLFANSCGGSDGNSITITKEQYELLKKVWG